MKIKLEEDLILLTNEKNKLRSGTTSHEKLIDTCKKVVQNLDIAYDKANTPTKQRIIGSVFPEKFIFQNNQVRTRKVNEAINRIVNKIDESKGNKKGQQSFYELLPCSVGATGFEPVTPAL